MMYFPFEMIFYLMIFGGSLISMISFSWIGVWVGMELNLFGLMPIFTMNKYIMEVESSVLYFITQSLGSSFILFGFFMDSFNLLIGFWLIFLGIIMKMGGGPFYFWIPKVMIGLSWINCIIMSTWQKMIPIFLFFMLGLNYMVMIMGMISCLVGSLGGINQKSMRSLMGFSSITHLGWIMFLNLIGFFYLFFYYLVYCILSIFIFLIIGNNNFDGNFLSYFSYSDFKWSNFMVVLSLSGIPPFIGFFSKLLSLFMLSEFLFLVILLLFSSFLSLYYYLVMSFSVVVNNNGYNWFNDNFYFFSWFGFFIMVNFFFVFLFLFI